MGRIVELNLQVIWLVSFQTIGLQIGRRHHYPILPCSSDLDTELTLDLFATGKGQDLTGRTSTGSEAVLVRYVDDWISRCKYRTTINGAAAVDIVCMDAYLVPLFLRSSTTPFRPISKHLQVSQMYIKSCHRGKGREHTHESPRNFSCRHREWSAGPPKLLCLWQTVM
jgi:hypothetical protein